MEQGDVEELRLFRLAGTAEPKMVHVWQAWGLLEMRQHNYQAARQHFQTAMWTHPGDATACMVWQVGPALMQLGRCSIEVEPARMKGQTGRWVLTGQQSLSI